jgi:hypothetical protein
MDSVTISPVAALSGVHSNHHAQYNQQAIREVERILKENLTAKN